MSLPHYRKFNKNFDTHFIYNDNDNQHQVVWVIYLSFDLENDNKWIEITLDEEHAEQYSLSHNFGDVTMIIINIYDNNGIIIRRQIAKVDLNKFKQKYESVGHSNYSRIELTFKVKEFEVEEGEDISTFESWFRNYKIDKILKS